MFDDEATVPGVPPWLELKREKPEHEPIPSESAIAQQLSEIRAELHQLRPRSNASPSFREIYEWFAPRYLPKGSAASFDGRVKNHLLPRLGELTSETLTPVALDELWRELKKTHAPQTINHLRNHGRRIIRMATMKGKRWPADVPNPFAQIDKLKVPKKRRDVPRPEQMGWLLQVIAETEFRNMTAFAVYYGLRQDEVLDFPLRHIHLERDTLTVFSSKNGAERELPILDEFRPYLLDQMERTRSPRYLFSRENGSRHPKGMKLRLKLRTAMKHAGLVRGYLHKCRKCGFKIENTESEIRACPNACMKLWVTPLPRNIDFHGLRHISATLHRKAGCDPLIVQLLLGHSGEGRPLTETVYTHFNEDEVREHLNKLSLRAKGGRSPNGRSGSNTGGSTQHPGPPEPKATGSNPVSRDSITTSLAFLTIGEVMSGLRVSRNTVMHLIRGGQLAAFRIGTQLRIKKDEFERFLAASAEPTR